jgi:cation:H+ antiporter
MNPLGELVALLGLEGVWTWLIIFIAASGLMIWRLEAMLERGLEGTALGAIVIPYCSGLGNLVFVWVVHAEGLPPGEIATNAIVNNVTNLTLVLAIPLLAWGLNLNPSGSGRRRNAKAEAAGLLTRLELLMTLAAMLFFSGVAWVLGRDGSLDRNDGLALVALFLFWQCLQAFEVMRHNVRKKRSLGIGLLLDGAAVLACAYCLFVSIEWLVAWVSDRRTGFFSVRHLGWLSAWLMVLPNAIVALYYARTRRADVVYASQAGDCHICIPLSLGLAAILSPVPTSGNLTLGLTIVAAATIVHGGWILFGGPPRWFGWIFVAAYAAFLGTGFPG